MIGAQAKGRGAMVAKKMSLIRASEVGEYVFCARAWRLRAEGHEPTRGQAARAAGTHWHTEHGRSVRRARRLRLLAVVSAMIALVVAILILLLFWS